MGKVTELVVTKGKTVKANDREEWLRVEYSVKAAISDNEELQVARAQMEGVIDGWLTVQPRPTPAPAAPQARPTKQWEKTYPLLGKGTNQLVGNMYVSGDAGEVVPDVRVKVDCGPIGWLKKKCLGAVKEVDSTFTWEINEENGYVKSVSFKGGLTKERLERLRSSFAWAFQASSQPS